MRNGRGRQRSRSSGPPAWLVFLVGAAVVFGAYYLFQGVQNFFRTGGAGVVEATERAQLSASATVVRVTRMVEGRQVTPRPTNTPIPECQDFVVSVPNAIVRAAPAPGGAIVTSINEGETVCVLGHHENGEWYVIDMAPQTRRLDLAYMHETVIRALNPTLTPSVTPTPLPTVTPLPTATDRPTPVPLPSAASATPSPDAAPTLPPPPTAATRDGSDG